MSEGKAMVCRCEEITKEEIIQAIEEGYTTIDAIKKRTRAGMGYCQGRVCRKLVAQLISVYSDIPIDVAINSSVRMPVGPLSLGLIAQTEHALEEEPCC